MAIARPLARVQRYLSGGGNLDAEARALLSSGDIATARWQLRQPRKLAEAFGAMEAVRAHREAGSPPGRV